MSEVISLFALFVALMSAFFTIKNYRVSVRPLLSVWQSTPDEKQKHHAITVKNCGNGPAIIESLKIFVDQEEISGEGFELMEKAVTKIFELDDGSTAADLYYAAYAGEGQPFGAGEERDIARFGIHPNFYVQGKDPSKVIDRGRLEIVYQDMYGTRWKVSFRRYKTSIEKLDSNKTIKDHASSFFQDF